MGPCTEAGERKRVERAKEKGHVWKKTPEVQLSLNGGFEDAPEGGENPIEG